MWISETLPQPTKPIFNIYTYIVGLLLPQLTRKICRVLQNY